MVSLSLDQSFYPWGEYENAAVFILPLCKQAGKLLRICVHNTQTDIVQSTILGSAKLR